MCGLHLVSKCVGCSHIAVNCFSGIEWDCTMKCFRMSVEKCHLLNAPLSISLEPNEGRKGRLDIAQNDYDLHKACSPHSGSLQIGHLYNLVL